MPYVPSFYYVPSFLCDFIFLRIFISFKDFTFSYNPSYFFCAFVFRVNLDFYCIYVISLLTVFIFLSTFVFVKRVKFLTYLLFLSSFFYMSTSLHCFCSNTKERKERGKHLFIFCIFLNHYRGRLDLFRAFI